jgi:FMN phosphatase YigB (HAD superfamily)
MKYQAIVFDLGGVLFHINYQKTIDAFKALGYKDFETAYSQAKQDGLFNEFEKGNISPPEFRMGIRKGLPPTVADTEVDAAWNAMLIGIPHEKILLLKRLKERYPLFLLSNTNEIHLQEVVKMNELFLGFPDLSAFMKKQYYSCRMGMRKPDKEIFLQVMQEQQLEAGQVLFVDDSIQHIEGAKTAGMLTHHLQNPDELISFFASNE